MEIYRQCGIEADIREAGLSQKFSDNIIWAETLSGKETKRWGGRWSLPHPYISQLCSKILKRWIFRTTPSGNCLCAQDSLERVLRSVAIREGFAELRFNTEVVAQEQDEGGVTINLVDRMRGVESRVRAQYVVAADGANSLMRYELGIRMIGRGALYDSINILFNADLTPWTSTRPAALYFIENETINATLLTINGIDRWGFLINNVSALGIGALELAPERAVELIRMAIGASDLKVDILSISPWTACAHVAEKYYLGRIFLVGDAAHEMPPTGGFGLNTGVQDAHNLVWKLAAVLQGVAGSELLDTYQTERRPVGQLVTEQSLNNAVSMGRLTGVSDAVPMVRDELLRHDGLVFGASYLSKAVIPDRTSDPVVANPVNDYIPCARPGRRMPHIWMKCDGSCFSSIDLIDGAFVLFTSPGGNAWAEAAGELALEMNVDLKSYIIGSIIRSHVRRWRTIFGISKTGAVLVRPDGYVAWRSNSIMTEPKNILRIALNKVLGRVIFSDEKMSVK